MRYLIAAAFGLVFCVVAGNARAADMNVWCLTGTGSTGGPIWQPASAANPCPVSATVTASIGGFTAASTGSPISVTTSNSTGTLPAGVEVVAANVGTTNGAYCALGATATTSSQYIAPNGGWFAFAVGASTQLTCVTSTSTTTVNTTGGAGLPTGTGGGGGGVGGGAVTIADGADVTQGAKADTAWTSGSGSVIALLKAIASGVVSAIPAGTNTIGNVGSVLAVTNGWTPLLANALSTTVKAVKSSAGQLGMLQCYNPNSSQIYVQVFSVVSGSVTLGTTVPVLSIPIAATSTGGYALSNPGISIGGTGMSVAATTTATGASAPSTAPDCNVAFN